MASRRAIAAPGEPQYTAGVLQASPESFNLSEQNQRLQDVDFDAFLTLPDESLQRLLQPVWDELHEVVEVPTTPAPGSVPAPTPATTATAPIPAPVTHAPQASGTWSQPANEPALKMGPGDLFDASNFFADFVPAPTDNRGGSAGLGVNFNSNGLNGLDATLSEPFNFFGEEGFDFQNSGFLSAANNSEIPASFQQVQELQSNGSGIMTNFHGAGYQVKNEVSPQANDFVFVQNDLSTVSTQPRNNFGQVANVSGHGTQAVPYTFSDSDHASQATPRSDGSNGFDYVHVEEAGPVNPARPGNPSPYANNLEQPGLDAIYQQFMNSQGFQPVVPAPTIPAPASVPAPRRNRAPASVPASRRNPASSSVSAPRRSRASASVPASGKTPASGPISVSAHFLPTPTVPPALPAATVNTAPPPVVATNTSTDTTAPPVPAPMLMNANNVPLTAQNYVPLIDDGILPPNPNGPRPIYPPFSNRFATGEDAKTHRKRSRGMIKNQAPDVERVKKFGRNYWVRRIYESIIDISNIDDGSVSVHRRRMAQDFIHDPIDLEATAHHIFDRAVAVHEIGWNRLLIYYKDAKRGKLVDVGEKCLERRLACICRVLQQQKSIVDDALRGGITLRLLCDNPAARGATKISNNLGNKKRGLRLKALREMGVKVPDVSNEPEVAGVPEEHEVPEELENSEDFEGSEGSEEPEESEESE
ncbi:hypothetical protein BM1_00135 [Bipolaris maydis]|nr:hypothetical protein BM1_00135 [Bipolaris maydis]